MIFKIKTIGDNSTLKHRERFVMILRSGIIKSIDHMAKGKVLLLFTESHKNSDMQKEFNDTYTVTFEISVILVKLIF